MLCKYTNFGYNTFNWIWIKHHKKPHPLLDPSIELGKLLFFEKHFQRRRYDNDKRMKYSSFGDVYVVEEFGGQLVVAPSSEVYKYIPNKNLHMYKKISKYLRTHNLLLRNC